MGKKQVPKGFVRCVCQRCDCTVIITKRMVPDDGICLYCKDGNHDFGKSRAR